MTFRVSDDFHDTHLYMGNAVLIPKIMIRCWTRDWNVGSKLRWYVLATGEQKDSSQWVLMNTSRHNYSTRCAGDLYLHILSKTVFPCLCDINPFSYTGQERIIYVVSIVLHIPQQKQEYNVLLITIDIDVFKGIGGIRETILTSCHFGIVTHFRIEFFVWSESRVPIYMKITNPEMACQTSIEKINFAIKNCASHVLYSLNSVYELYVIVYLMRCKCYIPNFPCDGFISQACWVARYTIMLRQLFW